MTLRLTVAIPTRDRPDELATTLAAVVAHAAPDDEILVIDDSPGGSAAPVVARFAPRVRTILSQGLGLAEARNRAVAECRTELICFCDDDATPTPGWTEGYRAAFAARPELAAAGGPILPEWAGPLPPWLEAYLQSGRGAGVFALRPIPDRDRADAAADFFGCNMAFRTEVLRRHPFPPELIGGETVGSGDTGLLRALRTEGATIVSLRGAAVRHRIGMARMEIAYLRRWGRHLGGTLAYEALRGKDPTPLRSFGYIARVLWAEGWRIPLGWSLWGSRRPAAIDRQITAVAVVEQLRYARRLLTDPVRQQAVREGR